MNRTVWIAAMLGACAPKSAPKDVDHATASALQATEASVEAALDRSVAPCDDFYQFACGGWMADFELPADRAIYGRGFSAIADRNEDILRSILDGGKGDPRLGRFYAACMDESAIAGAALAPVQADLAAVGQASTVSDLFALTERLPLAEAFLSAGVFPDFAAPDVNMFHLGQGGLGLPERGYYFPEDDAGRDLLKAYREHVATTLELGGLPPAGADAVLRIETRLAEASRPPDQMRDPTTLYHPTAVDALPSVAAGVPWEAMFSALFAGLDASPTQVNLLTPEFFPALGKLLSDTPMADLRTYLAWKVLHGAAPYVGGQLDAEHFAFFATRLSGQKEQRPRWKRCVQRTEDAMGELLGQAYVQTAFAGDSKATALAMVDDLYAAFEAGLPELAWMDDPTRTAAKAKLDAIRSKIGYPDAPETYDGLAIEGVHYADVAAAMRWSQRDELAKVGEEVDPAEWGMTAPTVNAYYNPLGNEIVFPAGILQPPMFSASFPAAMNYGGIGMVIGHEITHGFDDSGRKFGPDGTMAPWWDDAIAAAFDAQAQCLVDVFDAIEVQPGTTLNGSLTLGENIADFGGIKLASRAYARRTDAAGAPTIAGFTDTQLLYVAFAQSWCLEATPEIELLRARTDPHSPPRQRVNVPLAHLPAFHEAFACAEGTPMHPRQTCSVW